MNMTKVITFFSCLSGQNFEREDTHFGGCSTWVCHPGSKDWRRGAWTSCIPLPFVHVCPLVQYTYLVLGADKGEDNFDNSLH